MRILLLDQIQTSNAPDPLKSPALADKWTGTSLTIDLGGQKQVNAIGIGYTDARNVTIAIGEAGAASQTIKYIDSGLYTIDKREGSTVKVTIDGTYIGRLGLGLAHDIPISPRREPGYIDPKPRETVSGQLLPPVGEVSRRRISVDVRYRITAGMIADLSAASMGRSFPYFILFDKETNWIPWQRLYARDKSKGALQSSINGMLFSRKFDFVECF